MVELAPQTKIEEECPLLKVEGGSGDGNGRQQPPADPSAWSVTCSSKRSWFDRWPELLTACWMTGILLAISFLVMYVLTIGTVRRQPVIILKCNSSKPSSEFYYHQIVQKHNSVAFRQYSDYLANMAANYPLLHFNVIFLIDDTFQTNVKTLRHNKIYGRLIPLHPTIDAITNFEYHNNMDIREFEHKYQNVNITIIPLSKFMARTQLRYKWRTIPARNLPFYARVFSVWQTGGIGMDLTIFNNKYNNHLDQDKKITSILKQHNDGIKSEEYRRALDVIERNEESEFISVICGIVNQMLKETTDFFNSSTWFPHFIAQKESKSNEPLIRTHRNKRDITDKIINNIITSSNETSDLTVVNKTVIAFQDNKIAYFNASTNATNLNITENSMFMSGQDEKKINNTNQGESKLNTTSSHIVLARNIDELEYVEPNMLMTYEISLISDDLGMMFMGHPKLENLEYQPNVGKFPYSENIKYDKPIKTTPYFLTLGSEGSFVASTSRKHPLLGHLLLFDGLKRLPPKVAIQHTFLSQCAKSPKDDVYCNNIYLLNLV